MSTPRLFTVVIAVAACYTAPGSGQQRDMSIIDVLSVPALSSPELSPDGKQLLYVRSDADWEDNHSVSHIWRVDVDGSHAIQMTNGDRGETTPRWSPDGATVAFLSDRGTSEPAQIFLLHNGGGEAAGLTAHETALSSISWSPDGEYLFFLADDPKSDEEKAKDALYDDVYAMDEDLQERHLWRVRVSDGTEEQITVGDFGTCQRQWDTLRD